MKKYIILFVLLGFAVLASGAQAVDYNTNTSGSVMIKPATVNTGANSSASIKITPVPMANTVFTAVQIREKIAAVKMQMAAMQNQLTRLENALKEAEINGAVRMDTSLANTSAGVSANAAGMSDFNLRALKRMLFFGQKGEDVKKLQEILRAKGYLSGNADGSFGPQTLQALSAFQRAMNLKVSGAVDADTLNTINADATVSGSAETQ